MFGDNPNDRGGSGIDDAIRRLFRGTGQVAYTEFSSFCHDDQYVRDHCFGNSTVADAKSHLRHAAYAAGGDVWKGSTVAAQQRRY